MRWEPTSRSITTLIEGVQALSDGVKTFDEDGIQELTKLVGEDLREVIRRVKAVKQADEAYANFGGLAEGQTGSVKFIIETDEIKQYSSGPAPPKKLPPSKVSIGTLCSAAFALPGGQF